jgi:hypothetical protein
MSIEMLDYSSCSNIYASSTELLRRKVHMVNETLCLNIEQFPPKFFTSEDDMACFLYDVANLPIQMVLKRLRSQGAIVKCFDQFRE